MTVVTIIAKKEGAMAYNYAVLDIETTGLDRYKEKINYVGIGLAEDIGCSLGKIIIYNMYKDKDLPKLKSTINKLRERKVKLIWQNGKFDTLFLELHYGIKLPIHHDIMLMGTAYELNTSHALDSMAERYLGVPSWDIPLREKKKPNNPLIENEYLPKDLVNPWDLFCYFHENMTEQHWKIYNKLLKPGYLMYRNTERTGIYLDQDGLKAIKKTYHAKQKQTLKTLTGQYDINWNSPQQVSDVLFNQAGLPTLKLSAKTGKPSSDAKVLKRLSSQGFDLAKQLLEYKFYYGANTKFLNQWGGYAEYDGRIHPSFNQTNVITGRTSCSNPNLQQVPRNKELRTLFTAAPGRVLIEADYSQIELRIAADYANEPTMIKIYKTGGDIHTETGCLLAGCPPNKLTKEQRSRAKPVNFGFLYGMGYNKFVEYAFDSYDVVFTAEEAKRFRELYFQKYSRLQDWHREMEELCEAQGGVYNRFGQFMALPDVYNDDRWVRAAAVRKAINSPVQGTASQLLVGSAVEVDKVLRPEMDAWVVGTVHDAMLVDCPEEYKDEAVTEIKRIMSHPKVMDIFEIEFKVPIEADVGIGAWGAK
jgi:DNA polymerase I-like protein with 3'-5' exonuclease and polymerase domains